MLSWSRLRVPVLAIVLGLFGFVIHAQTRAFGRIPVDNAPPQASRPAAVAPAFKTEAEWIAGTVVRNLATMCLAAGREPARVPEGFTLTLTEAPGDVDTFTVRAASGDGRAPIDLTLALPHGVWWPPDYLPFAERARSAWCPGAAAAPDDDSSVATALLQPEPGVIEAQNGVISQRLASARLLDAGGHEAAALLLGTFALREASGTMSDPRHALSRMTAHLAFARALAPSAQPGAPGRYATIVLLALAGRGADALTGLQALESRTEAPYASWNRALRMRVTQDWRLLPEPASATLLERLEYLRARVATSSEKTRAVVLADETLREPIADWGRIAVQEGISVANGNRFLTKTLEPERAEIARIWTLTHDTAVPASLVDALNQPADDYVTPQGGRVIGWGMWAAFLQRHLVFYVERVHRFYRSSLGVLDEAKAFDLVVDKEFGALDLYPAARLFHQQDTVSSGDCRSADEAIRRAQRQPQLLTARNWEQAQICSQNHHGAAWKPTAAEWFMPVTLRSPYEAGRRVKSNDEKLSFENAESLLRVAFFDRPLVRLYFDGRMPAIADLKQKAALAARILAPRLEYDSLARGVLEDYLTGAEWRASRTRSCELAADACYALARSFADAGEDDRAAAIYERVMDDPTVDQIGASQRAEWLVSYYVRRGKMEQAEETALKAASTYSANGLQIAARLFERTKRYDEAEEFYRRAAERYDTSDVMVAFYHRMARGRRQAAYEPQLERAIAQLFPDGLRRYEAAAYRIPPKQGVFIYGQSADSTRADVRPGDVVIALDGWLVDNPKQYAAVRGFVEDAPLNLTIWRDGTGVIRRSGTFKDRLMGIELRPYPCCDAR
jgi:tetratricopeptide (TPR) repeat protein